MSNTKDDSKECTCDVCVITKKNGITNIREIELATNVANAMADIHYANLLAVNEGLDLTRDAVKNTIDELFAITKASISAKFGNKRLH